MNLPASEFVLLAFLAFCRIGGCFLVVPGMSSARVPSQVRLYLAIAISGALLPLATDPLRETMAARADPMMLIATETATGVFIGLLIRIFFLALDFAAIAVANFVGYGAFPGAPIESTEPTVAMSTFITLPAMALFFILDQHLEVIRALGQSYVSMPPGQGFESGPALQVITKTTETAFRIALQVSAPFVVYGLTINFLFGVMNKMLPQVPVYFISAPFVIAGGLVLLYTLIAQMLAVFGDGMTTWFQRL